MHDVFQVAHILIVLRTRNMHGRKVCAIQAEAAEAEEVQQIKKQCKNHLSLLNETAKMKY